MTNTSSLATRCIHAGSRPTPERPELVTSTVRSATFLQHAGTRERIAQGRLDDVWVYGRYGNPSLEVLEERLADLEGAQGALVLSSGMAAMHAGILSLCQLQGGRVVVLPRQVYGGTHDLLVNGLAPLGFEVRCVDLAQPGERREAMEGAHLVVCESLSNPCAQVADLPGIVADARAAGARVLVDATFASPVLQRPLEHGADLVMHSATKYLGGHSDLIAGVLAGGGDALAAARTWRKRAGGCLDPEAGFLLERGLKTLALRMRAHSENALRLARVLDQHEAVARVHYPGLESHATHGLAGELLDLPGGMLGFELARGGDAAAQRLVESLELALDAPSLGGVETLVSLPVSMSHAGLTPEERLAAGIGPGFVRVSVGVEDADDLERDFLSALERCFD